MDYQNFEKMLNAMTLQAKAFLKEMGMFYPFGTAVNKKGEITPIGAFVEDENLSSNILIQMLEKRINEGIADNTFIMGAIGIDVNINLDHNKKSNAVEIRTIQKGNEKWGYVYLPYNIENKEVLFGEFKTF